MLAVAALLTSSARSSTSVQQQRVVAESGGFKMSGDDDAAAAVEENRCASCGRAQVDGVKLKDCDGCDLVRYCSDECEANHKSEHEEACKKRAVVLRDEVLFKQPQSTHLGDCPICTIPLPLDAKYMIRMCCCKFICDGCNYRSEKIALEQERPYPECPFCRDRFPPSKDIRKVFTKQLMKRVKAKDPEAMCLMGGEKSRKGDSSGAFELYTKAAELGHAGAHFKLAELYWEGLGVEKDSRKYIHHLEEAAIAGHPGARRNLAVHEFNEGNRERSAKHHIIAANQGFEESMECLVRLFKLEGMEGGERSVSKEDLAAALRGHHAALKATKSPEREEAAEYNERQKMFESM